MNTITVTGAGSQWSVGGVLSVGGAGSATLNILDGGFVGAQIGARLGFSGTGAGVINIAGGGTLATTNLTKGTGSGQVNFNDATLRALASDPAFMGTLTVSELIIAGGGLTVDTNGFSIGGPGFSGTGSLTTTGTGSLTLTDVSTYTGDTIIGSGSTLALSGAGAIASNRVVADGRFDVSAVAAAGIAIPRLEGVGTVALGAKALTVDQIAPGGAALGTLTIDGNYAGTGTLLEIQSTLAGDGAAGDLLAITGNSTGNTNVAVTKVGSSSGATVNGIRIVDVAGASTGSFTLLGDMVVNGQQAVAGGAYLYGLYQGTPTSADGDWYLRSLVDPADPGTPIFQPAAPVVEAYVAAALQSFNEMDTLQQRLGNRSWSGGIDQGRGLWGRIETKHLVNAPGSSTTGARYTVDTLRLQGGVDGVIGQSDDSTIVGGANLQIGNISADIGSASGSGKVTGTAVGLGGGLTWFGDSGLYLDAQGKLTWFDTSLYSNTLGRSIVSGNDGFGYAFSLETGQQFAVGDKWSVTPQAQMSYSRVGFTDFLDPFGNTVRLDRSDSLVGRLGISADYEADWQDTNGQAGSTHLYGVANASYELLGDTSTLIGTDSVSSKNDPLWGGVGLGGSLDWADERVSLFGEANVATSLNNVGKSYSLGVTAGINGKF
ncbi:MAG: autotransporter outer membrane beta-barrel domain-containing protein [Devosia sp.]